MPKRQTVRTVIIDGRKITSEESFHAAFAEAIGFPDYYGANLDAWFDCMTSVDSPESGMVRTPIPEGSVLTIQIAHAGIARTAIPTLWKRMLLVLEDVNDRLKKSTGTRIRITNAPASALETTP